MLTIKQLWWQGHGLEATNSCKRNRAFSLKTAFQHKLELADLV